MKRAILVGVTAAGVAAVVGAAIGGWPPLVLWNTTASAPIGLYRLQREHAPRVGDWVVVRPPKLLAAWLAERGFLPAGVPLLKRIAATAPSAVCRSGAAVDIDGSATAVARRVDRFGRRLPVWSGCHRLTPAEVFLLNADAPGSLDGRYFGPLPVRSIVGHATPVWIWRGR